MFARKYLILVLFILSSQLMGQAFRPNLLSPADRERLIPSGVAVMDDTDYSNSVQNYLVSNQQFLVSDPSFAAAIRSATPEQQAEYNRARTQVLAEARDLTQRLRGTIEITQENMLDVCEDRPSDLVAALVARTDDQTQEEDCRNIPLQVGQSARFNHRSRLQVPAYQVVKRLDANRYQASLNLNVTDAGDPANGPRTLEKIRGCMNTIAPYLKGPDGKTMEIRILTPAQTALLPEAERPMPANISVAQEAGRGHAFSYHNDWKCDTITHEILHLFGLCDEYHENGGFVAEWSCRVVPETPSIMGNHFDFFPTAVARTVVCPCRNAECLAALTRLPRSYTEPRIRMENPCMQLGSGMPLEVRYGSASTETQSGPVGNNLVIVTRPIRSSLVTDVQFTKMISGYCQREAPGYARCSQFSQISSQDSRCRNIPPECSNENYYRGTVR